MARIEAAVGTTLTADYAAFLRRFGAATFSDPVALRLPDGVWADVHVWFGSDPDDSFDLSANLDSLAGYPMHVPVACDPYGNIFCLDLAPGLGRGRVRFLDLAEDCDQTAAESFNDFIARLRRLP